MSNVIKSRLLMRTVELLKNRPRSLTLEMIAENTGLTRAWLWHIINTTRYNSCSVDRVEVLYEYLTQSKLELR